MRTTHTRAQHLCWCKKRALSELEHGEGSEAVSNALLSLTSDLNKHPETIGHPAVELGTRLVESNNLATRAAMAGFIDDIN